MTLQFALEEPESQFVYEVEPECIMSDYCSLKSFDLYTLRKEEIPFRRGFELTARRRGAAHAFALCFGAEFSFYRDTARDGGRMGFSNMPSLKMTNVFSTNEDLAAERDTFRPSSVFKLAVCYTDSPLTGLVPDEGRVIGVVGIDFGSVQELKNLSVKVNFETRNTKTAVKEVRNYLFI